MTKLITTSQFLQAYSEGSIGPEEAIRGIGGLGYSHLFDSMARHDFPLPRGRGREKEIAKEVREGLPVLRAALFAEKKHAE